MRKKILLARFGIVWAMSAALAQGVPTRQIQTVATLLSTGFSTSAIQNGDFVQDTHYREAVVLDRYDAYGNVTQQHETGDRPVTHLWGYGGKHLIAEVEKASYNEVVAVLGQAVINQLTGANPDTDTQARQHLQSLRQGLQQAPVTSYTYDPLVGMTSQTDATGRTTTYEYDGLGRLLRARDEQGRIRTQNEYHYTRP